MDEHEYKETYGTHRKDFDFLQDWEKREYFLQAREVVKFISYAGLVQSK